MTSDRRYTIGRGDQKYGPYTLEEVRSYVAQGSIAPSDLVWTEGMTDWRPLSELLARTDLSGAPQPPPLPVHDAVLKRPPSMHWLVVLLLGLITFGLFFPVWAIVQAIWVRQIDPASKGLKLLAIGLPVGFVLAFVSGLAGSEGTELLANLVIAAAAIVAYFDMRATIETRYGLELSGIMTFFFNVLYFQYHLRKIAKGTHQPRATGFLT
jgi:hypothetical protein